MDAERHVRPVRHDALDPAVGQVVDVVEARNVDAFGTSQPEQDLVPTARAALGLPLADDPGDLQDGLLAVAEHGGVDEVGDRLGIEGGVAAGDDDRVLIGAVARVAAG